MKNYSAVLNGEAGLAGIQAAVQSRQSSRYLHRQIDDMLSPGFRSGPLHLTRVKYKPHKRLSAYYTTAVLDPKGDQAHEVPFVLTWSAGEGQAPDTDLVFAMEAEAGRRGLLAPFVRLQRPLDGEGLLQIWPLDPDFPQLVRLGDPAFSQALFQSAGIQAAELTPDCVRVSPVRYRPGERHVLRIQIDATGSQQAFDPTRTFYAKLYRDSQSAARAARTTHQAADWLESNLPGFYAIRPAGFSLENQAILYPHADGLPLSRQLRRSGSWLGKQYQRVGMALAILHRGPTSLTAELGENTLEKEIKVIRRASEHIQVLLPETGGRISALLDRAQEGFAHLPQEKPTFTHSDFKADHLIINAAGMSLIDFDTCALADPALDIGKFLADLEWWYARTRTPGVEQAQEKFLNGYPNVSAQGRLERARLYQVLILVKIAIRRTRLYWKDWELITNQMVERAEQIYRLLEPA